MAANINHNGQRQELDKDKMLQNRSPSGSSPWKQSKSSSSLEILDPEDSLIIEPYNERPSSTEKRNNHSIGSVPPRQGSGLSRNSPIPNKQISLQAVKRKKERDDPILTDIDWKELQSHKHEGRENSFSEKFNGLSVDGKKAESSPKKAFVPFSHSQTSHNCSGDQTEKPSEKKKSEVSSSNTSKISEASGATAKPKPVDNSETGKKEDSDDADTDSEEEEKNCPDELLMEFLSCLMEKDYLNAQKLCKMILLYEPNNPEALNFQPLIDEKLELDNESDSGSGESGNDEDGDDEGDDEDDSDDDSDNDSDSSDSDSDDSDDSDDDDEDDSRQRTRLDSGIASASSVRS